MSLKTPVARAAAMLLSTGWLIPAGLGANHVLDYLNEDMARLALLRNSKPSFQLPTEFNTAPSIRQAREQFTYAGLWLALVIAGWTLYLARARGMLQSLQERPLMASNEQERALEQHFAAFSDQLQVYRNSLTEDFGVIGRSGEQIRGAVHGRFDAVDAELLRFGQSVEGRLGELGEMGRRLEQALEAAGQARQEALLQQQTALRALGEQLVGEIQSARHGTEAQLRAEQEQRFVSIHNAIQVLGAQVEDRLRGARQGQDEALAGQLQSMQGLVQGLVEGVGRELAQQVGQQVGQGVQEVHGELLAQREQLAQAVDAQRAERQEAQAALSDQVSERVEAVLARQLEPLPGHWAQQLDQRLATTETLQRAAQEEQRTVVTALTDQLGETLQLQRDAGGEARRRAEAAQRSQQEQQAAQTETLAELGRQVGRLFQAVEGLQEQARASAMAEPGWVEGLAGLRAQVQPMADRLAQVDQQIHTWGGQQQQGSADAQAASVRLENQLLRVQDELSVVAGQVRDGWALLSDLSSEQSNRHLQLLAGLQSTREESASQLASGLAGLASQGAAASLADQMEHLLAAVRHLAAQLQGGLELADRQREASRSELLERLDAAVSGFGDTLHRGLSPLEEGLRAAFSGKVQALHEELGQLARRVAGQQQEAAGQRSTEQTQQLQALEALVGRLEDSLRQAQGQHMAEQGRRLDDLHQLSEGLGRQLQAAQGHWQTEWAALSNQSHELQLDAQRERHAAWERQAQAMHGLGEELRRVGADLRDRLQGQEQTQGLALQASQQAQQEAARERQALRDQMEHLQAQLQALHLQQQDAMLNQGRRTEEQIEGLRQRLDRAGERMQEQGALSARAEELTSLRGELEVWQQNHQAAQQRQLAEAAAQRQAQADTLLQLGQRLDRLASDSAAHWEGLRLELPNSAQPLVLPLAQRLEEQSGRLGELQRQLQGLMDTIDQQDQQHRAELHTQQEQQARLLDTLAERLDHSLQAAQAEGVQRQEARLQALQQLAERIDQNQQAAERRAQAEQLAMLQALERRLVAIDTLESHVERLEGMLQRAGVQGLAARLGELEKVLSAAGPTLLEARLRQMEELLQRNTQTLDSRLGDLQGLVTTTHARFEDTQVSSNSDRLLDERRLQQLCLNLSDLQENLRLERRQLRKKFETLHKDAALS
jgi:hypothetical protein